MKVTIHLPDRTIEILGRTAYLAQCECIIATADADDVVAKALRESKPTWEDLPEVARHFWRHIAGSVARSTIRAAENQITKLLEPLDTEEVEFTREE